MYKSANTQRFDSALRPRCARVAPALQADKVNEYIAHRQREAGVSKKAFSTPHIRFMFAGHALGTRWMGAIPALNE